jgi:hypothetical protein
MSADTRKMPDPIIDPTTTIVESNKPSPRLNSVSRPALASSCRGCADVVIQALSIDDLRLTIYDCRIDG